MDAVDKYFKLTERGSTIATEFRAGTATFMTLCYILAGPAPLARRLAARASHALHRLRRRCSLQRVSSAVNSRLLSDSGGPCEYSPELAEDFACRFYDPVYEECVENFRRQLVTVCIFEN